MFYFCSRLVYFAESCVTCLIYDEGRPTFPTVFVSRLFLSVILVTGDYICLSILVLGTCGYVVVARRYRKEPIADQTVNECHYLLTYCMEQSPS